MDVIFDRRIGQETRTSSDVALVWDGWLGEKECWLFVAPHDDDIVCGAGLTFAAALARGIRTYAAVISNGRMGYCSAAQRQTIVNVRSQETRDSFKYLGLPDQNLFQFDYDDGSLALETGRRFAACSTDSRAIAGSIGLQNTMTWLLRHVKPNRIFIPNRLDLHPDHRAVNSEMIISIFHAQGEIWPELGPPIQTLPTLYEYATYSDFIQLPNIRVRVSDDLVEKRLKAIALYKSQRQIELVVDQLRKVGGKEYLLEMEFEIFNPAKYEALF